MASSLKTKLARIRLHDAGWDYWVMRLYANLPEPERTEARIWCTSLQHLLTKDILMHVDVEGREKTFLPFYDWETKPAPIACGKCSTTPPDKLTTVMTCSHHFCRDCIQSSDVCFVCDKAFRKDIDLEGSKP